MKNFKNILSTARLDSKAKDCSKRMIAWKASKKKNRSLLKIKWRKCFTLSEPNDELKEHFLVKIKRAFLHCNKTFSELTSLYEEKFQNTGIRLSKNELHSAVQRIIAKNYYY